MKKILGMLLALALGLVPAVSAQVATGNIYGTVTDSTGAVLPGASVQLTSPVGERTTVAGSLGEFRFLNLDKGTYKTTVSLPGFTTVNREVVVTTGVNVELTFTLNVATVEEVVTVTVDTPVVDTKKVGTSTILTKEELADIPNSRDPWAILRTIPGVMIDRVNIAGNESGQQSNFGGKGDDGSQAMWNLDGVVITDMASLSSPDYYDYDAFEEISVTTGGNDIRVQTGGIGINLVTRRGTNDWHGSARGFMTHDDLQWSNVSGTDLATDPRLQGNDKADHIQQISDYGGELGGPLVKDKLWVYGSWGRQDIRVVRLNQTADKTKLTSANAKLNWQPSPNTSASVFWFLGSKTKDGRAVGFGVEEADSFLWNQGSDYVGGPHGFTKAEINHVFSPNFFLNAKYSYYNTGFGLHPRGGDVNGTVDYAAGVARGAYAEYITTRPAHTVNVDGNYFVSGWGGNHELKFGFGYRKTTVDSATTWGGNQLFSFDLGGGYAYAQVKRNAIRKYEGDFASAYVGDTFTKDRVTLNVGVRFDRQTAKNNPTDIPANRSFPDLLPGASFDANVDTIEWNDVAPRVGLTYALDESRKTLLRASYARYASQLYIGNVTVVNPSISPGSYLAYVWNDFNGDGFAQPDEVRTDLGLQYFGYVDPNDPSGPSPNRIDPDYKAQHDDEFIVGLDRELAPNLGVSVSYTYKRTHDLTKWFPRIGITPADYAPETFDASGYTTTGFIADPDLVAAAAGGRILTNRPDYHQVFSGVELTLQKRLSKKWAGRVVFSYNDWKEYLDGPGAISNPTRTDTNGGATFTLSGPQVDGGQVAPLGGGSGKAVFYSGKWQVIANGLYQLPGGFEIAGSLFGRQGYPNPIVIRRSLGDDGRVRMLATPLIDTNRFPDLWNLDLRLAKSFKLTSGASIVLTADAFNVFNANTELQRQRDATSDVFGRLDEILSPRIVRFGARLTF
jgi:Carboxypeptidase regulatory-like domain/TonB-dependent Receptor Plug Domain